MKFYNKAQTLNKLICKNAIIPKLIIVKVKDFLNKKEITLSKVIKNFDKNCYLIVRSSSITEDTNKKSNAGKYKSIPMVKNRRIDLENAIQDVINSYEKNKKIQFYLFKK